jgi:hypothetical protein
VWLMSRLFSLLLISLFSGSVAAAENSYDYFSANRQLVRNGLQAVLMCNGLYTSNRHVIEIFEQQLAYLTGARVWHLLGLRKLRHAARRLGDEIGARRR